MASDTVTQIKEKLTIVEVISPYVKLTKAGKYMRGLSPFTKEKTPSFYVNPERGSYYCFSTSQGGDQFTFIEKMEGVDFKGAMKILAEKAGVEIVYEKGSGDQKDRSDRLREAMAEAVQFYAAQFAAGELNEGVAALTYAKDRGLKAETIAQWQLGYAPDAWRSLLEYLQGKGFTQSELLAAGLIKEADGRAGTFYDRFRNRLMFPIRDSAGRTVAFTGRALAKDDQAKYLNSPETDLFKKHEVLFGMDRAKDAIRTRGFAILVEGQFDLILLHQIGFTNTIALSGTALSTQHLNLIKRYADNLMLCLDADRAGLAASAKNAQAAFAAGMRVKAVRLPEGKDPADLASTDPKDFAKRVSDATSIVEFFLSVISEGERDQLKLVQAAERVVLPLLGAIQSPMEREHFLGVTARALGMPLETIRLSLAKMARENPQSGRGAESSSASSRVPSGNQPPRTGMPSAAVVSTKERVSIAEQRGQRLLAVAASYPDSELAKKLISEYSRINGTPAPNEPIGERAIFEAGLTYGESPSDSTGSDLIRMFEHAVLTERLTKATDDLRRAEAVGDTSSLASLVALCTELSNRLAAL